MTTDNSAERSILYLIIGVGLFIVMGGALIGPVLPALTGAFNVPQGSVGLVFGVYALTALIALPFVGYLTDCIGRKKVLVPSLLLNGLAGFSCIFAPNFNILLTARAIQGIGVAGMALVAITLIGDFYGGLGKVKAMGTYTSTLALGATLAPIIGGVLANIGWELPFSIYFLSIPLAVGVWLWLPPPQKGRPLSLREYLRPFKTSLTDPGTLGVLFSNFLTFFLLYSMVTFVPLLLSQIYGVSETIIGIFLAVQGAAVATVAVKADSIVRAIPMEGAICLGFLISGSSLFILPAGLPLILIVLPIGVFGIGRDLIQPQINVIMTDVAPRGRLGGLVSIYNIMKYAGQMSAPLVLGWILTIGGFDAVFRIAGIMSLIAFAAALKGCAGEL